MCAPPASAQVTTGTIVGTVHDPNGIVPGATVTIREVNQGTANTYVTDETGSYHRAVPHARAPTRVEVNVQGFRRWRREGVILQVNQRARVDVTLEVGGIEETTTVVAEAPLLRTDSSEVGTVIEERAIKELPLNGRNFATLVYLTPGITPGQAGENLSGASTFNPRGASNFNALGHQANANAWLIDGIDNNEYSFNTVIIAPSVEQVREFKVLTGVFSAEFGRGAGVVSVATKSGSNLLHGTVFEYLRNDAFDARNFFVRKVSQADGSLVKDPKPPLDRHQFGAAVGGPLVLPGLYDGHNRTFFFADYAGLNEKRGQVFVNTVPTALTRTGNFSDFRDANGNLIIIYDPLTTRANPAFDSTRPVSATNPQFLRDPYPNNIIPAERMNRVGQNVASIYPLPNGPGNFNNYTSTVDRVTTDNVFSGRVDHQFSEKSSFFTRFNWGRFKLDAPQGQAACCLATPAEAAARFDLGPYVAGIQNTRLTTHGAAFNYSRIISPSVVNELRVGYARTVPSTFQSDFGINAADSLGIRGINVTEFTTGLPNINIPDLTGISGGPAFLPVNPKQFHWQIEDALVWVKGRHQLKFGYRLVDRYPSPFTNTDTRGSINFGRNYTNNPVTNTGGSGIASLLTGYINSAARGFLLEPYMLRTQEHGMFVQDDLKLSSRFTINAGLRYEIFRAETEEDDKIVNFDPTEPAVDLRRHRRRQPLGQQEDAVPQLRAAARADLRPARRPVDDPAHGIRHHLLPGTAVGVEHDRPAGAVHDLAERQLRDQPDRLQHRAHARRSVPADRAGHAAHHRRTAGGEPARAGALVRQRNALRGAVAPRRRAARARRARRRDDLRRQRRQAHHLLLQPERGAAGHRLARVAPADSAAQPVEQHAAVRSAQPVDLPLRSAQGDAALPRRPAAARQLYLQQVARLRRIGRERRRRGRQPADRHQPGGGQGAVGLRRAPPRGRQLGLRAAVGTGPALAGQRRRAQRDRRRMAVRRHLDAHHRAAVHGLHADRREQRRPELAEPHRLGQAR